MGRVDFKSEWVRLERPAGAVFPFFDDLNNLEKLMPPQVINWKSDRSSCAFDIKGMAHISLVKTESVADQLIRISGTPENPIELEFVLEIVKEGGLNSSARVNLSAQLSMMLQMMASDPLQNLVNIMAGKIREAISQI